MGSAAEQQLLAKQERKAKTPAKRSGKSAPKAKRATAAAELRATGRPAKKSAAPKPAPDLRAHADADGRAHWLFKSEPDVFSWQMQKSRGAKGEPWTGVRNFLARNNMQAMRIGDLGFFYHSNEGKEIVGIVRVIRLARSDPEDDTGVWQCVDVEAVTDMPSPVTLAAVKANPRLARMSLVTSMRLSVQPVRPDEWMEVCSMGGLDPKKLRASP